VRGDPLSGGRPNLREPVERPQRRVRGQVLWHVVCELRELVEARQLIVEGAPRHGRNPLIRIERDSWPRSFTRLAAEFGFEAVSQGSARARAREGRSLATELWGRVRRSYAWRRTSRIALAVVATQVAVTASYAYSTILTISLFAAYGSGIGHKPAHRVPLGAHERIFVSGRWTNALTLFIAGTWLQSSFH
jgi:hypothetical protein